MTPEEIAEAERKAKEELVNDLDDLIEDLTPDPTPVEDEKKEESPDEETPDDKDIEEDEDDSKEETGEEAQKDEVEEDKTPTDKVEKGEGGEKGEAAVEEKEEIVDNVPLTEREKKLIAQIEKLSGQISTPTSTPAKTEVKEEPPSKTIQQTTESFLGDLNLDDILEDPKLFNQVLLNLANHVEVRAIEKTLLSVPELVTRFVSNNTALTKMADDFYKANPDLAEVRKTVSVCANEAYHENPALTTEQLFEEAGKRARKILALPEPKAGKTVIKVKKANPSFAKGSKGGNRTEVEPDLTEMEKDIIDLL